MQQFALIRNDGTTVNTYGSSLEANADNVRLLGRSGRVEPR